MGFVERTKTIKTSNIESNGESTPLEPSNPGLDLIELDENESENTH